MPTIADMIGPEAGAEAAALPEAIEQEAGGVMGGLDFSWLLKPTGPGGVEDYLEHPLNPRKSRGLAQMLRGATGFFGEGLRAAIADIAFGGMEYMRERKLEAINAARAAGQA